MSTASGSFRDSVIKLKKERPKHFALAVAALACLVVLVVVRNTFDASPLTHAAVIDMVDDQVLVDQMNGKEILSNRMGVKPTDDDDDDDDDDSDPLDSRRAEKLSKTYNGRKIPFFALDEGNPPRGFDAANGIHIITTFFKGSYSKNRVMEILNCLKKNMDNPHITAIHVLWEDVNPRDLLRD